MKLLYYILIFLLCSHAWAFKFSPMSLTINPVEGEKNAQVYLENDSSSPIAIQISLAKRFIDKNGIEKNIDESEEIEAYPTQLIIPPYEKRSVKITSKLKNIGEIERAYRIIAEQLPIELDKNNKKVNVKLLLRYIAALYVDNGKTEAKIELNKINYSKNSILFSIKNSGSKHQVLSNLKVLFKKDKEKEVVIDSKDLKNFSGENILAGTEREFSIPVYPELKKVNESYKVELKFDKEK